MIDTLVTWLWLFAFYGFGAVGLLSIGAFPLRVAALMRLARASSTATLAMAEAGSTAPLSTGRRVAILLVSGATLALAAQPLLQLGRCLLGYHCSANAAGGWIQAVHLGVVYVLFELAVIALSIGHVRLHPDV